VPDARVRDAALGAIARGVDDGVFPSAVARISVDGDVVAEVAAGRADVETVYDVASLTKLFTATVAGILWARGDLDLAEPAVGGATVEDLLRHRSGLAAWHPFYERIRDEAGAGGPVPGTPAAAERLVQLVRQHPATAPPGRVQVYSDLGFILLGDRLARLARLPLDTVVAREVCGPFGLKHTGFRPGRSGRGDPRCAPTEDCPWRGEVLRGEVHDDNAWVMGGVAGHAGIFSTAADIGRFAEAWLAARRGAGGPLAPAVVERFWRLPEPPATYALGWDTPTPGASSAGCRFSRHSFGHLGFTGTSVWVDAERGWVVVLLTNRVHPRRDNDRIRAFRPAFHDAVALAIDPEAAAG